MFEGAARFTLKTQHWNPPAIERVASLFLQEHSDAELRQALQESRDDAFRFIECTDVLLGVRRELERLLDAGVRPQDVAILSLAGKAPSELLTHDKLGSIPVVPADSDRVSTHVIADTSLRFKGLERPFVIAAEVAKGRTTEFRTRMYIALTRGTVEVSLVCGVGVLSPQFGG